MISPTDHPFTRAPHRTILALAVPTFFAMVAEPMTGLVDTAVIARLGAGPLAALGVGATALSALFWVFNFLGIGTQTEVAQSLGRDNPARAARVASLALLMSLFLGVLLILLAWPFLVPLARLLGASGEVEAGAVIYMRGRLFGAPAALLMLATFGALRGCGEVRIPLWVALLVNGINILLDPILVFGLGTVPAYGIAGAAWASTGAQWLGALVATVSLLRRIGWGSNLDVKEAGQLLRVGGDLFVRTGLLTLFLLLTTRWANRGGVNSGAAHQAIRGVWLLTAMSLDALALSAQTLSGYFYGAGQLTQLRRAARISCAWGVGTGLLIALAMMAATAPVGRWLVPLQARPLFIPAWLVAAAMQPLLALAFVTDGLHWGTSDYRFLRNAMFVATLAGVLLLSGIDPAHPYALLQLWLVLGLWSLVRASAGVLRIWPGIGASPFNRLVGSRDGIPAG